MANTTIPSELIADGAITSAKLDTNIAVGGTLGVTGETTMTGLTVSASNNGDPVLGHFYNDNAGTATEATVYITNSSTIGDGLFLETTGSSFTTVGGFVQDGGVIGTGAGASGGLSIMTRANADMRFYTNGHTNERLRIDASGNVGIGTSSPDGKLHVHTATAGAITADGSADDLVIENSTNGGLSILTPDASYGSIALGSPTSAAAAVIDFSYNAGILALQTYKVGASIALKADNGVTNLTLSGASGSESAVFTGTVTATDGIYLGGTAAANLLDDYEEGTWTPNIQRNGGTIPATFSTVSATYVKIGNIVHAKTYIGSLSNGSSDGTSYWVIYNMPFAAQVEDYSGVALAYNGSPCNTTYVGDAGGNAILCVGNAPYTGSLSGEFMLNITYRVN